MRHVLAAACALTLTAAPSAGAQGSSISVTPRIGFAHFGTVYDGRATYEGIDVDAELDPAGQFTYGAAVELQLPSPKWSLFGEAALGDGTLDSSFCVEGFGCDGGEVDIGSLHVALGVARELRSGAAGGPAVRLRLGGSILRLSIDEEGAEDSYTNPGVLAGVDLAFALTQRARFEIGLDDVLARSDTDGFEEDFEAAEGGDLELDSAWINTIRLNAGVRIGF